MSNLHLLKKYNKPVPRYTSYPTVPFWNKTPTTQEWVDSLNRYVKPQTKWCSYLHIPFCETLCSYCGCNTIITKDHSKLPSYLDLIFKELDLYIQKVDHLATAPLHSLHFGGGSPSFIGAKNMASFLDKLYSTLTLDQNFSGSIELDPRRVKKELITTLKKFNFNRLSFGVQDFNPHVQACLNRLQPFEQTAKVVDYARSSGFDAINFDLIYGLPKQDMSAMEYTIECTLKLRPHRIALYSLAMVPWEKKQQRLIKEEDLPSVELKRELYNYSREQLLTAGYVDIGMDHFALPDDPLAIAKNNNTLHRNFMGYTEHRTDLLLGLGVSSISDTPDCFHQNQKVLPKYESYLAQNNIPTMRGHLLSEDDQKQREKILQFMTQFAVELSSQEMQKLKELDMYLQDGLIELDSNYLKLTPKGEPFLRNVATFFDHYLQKNIEHPTFSKSI